jgi:hypothetical protein
MPKTKVGDVEYDNGDENAIVAAAAASVVVVVVDDVDDDVNDFSLIVKSKVMMHRSYVLLSIVIVYIRQGWRYGERNRMQQRNHDYNMYGTIHSCYCNSSGNSCCSSSGSSSCCIRRSNGSSSSYRFSCSSSGSSSCSYAQQLRKI